MVVAFIKPEHQAVAVALHAMDHDLLAECRCWFAGGTEIVLDLGEYRLSKDIDFLCADAAGYREMRNRVMTQGASGLFGPGVQEIRPFRGDQYGIRGIVGFGGIPLRFEIIREARITLDGLPDRVLGVPRLAPSDRIAEKLLANADRCQDRATSYRDAIDLGMLAAQRGPFPTAAVDKAERAYGEDIRRKVAWVLDQLAIGDVRSAAAMALGMDAPILDNAVQGLRNEATRIWPDPVDDHVTAVPPAPPRD